MWALRRASHPFKVRCLSVGSRICCATSDIPTSYLNDLAITCESSQAVLNEGLSSKRSYHTGHVSLDFWRGKRSLSSQAEKKNGSEEDDLEDGFSELETPATADADQEIPEDDIEEDLLSETEASDGDDVQEPAQDDLELLGVTDTTQKKRGRRRVSLELFKVVKGSPDLSVHTALDKWVEEGKDIGREEYSFTMVNLRRRQMYARALQLSEWLEKSKRLDFGEGDYASRLDLIAKVKGVQKAESYIQKIPESFRSELVYRTYLACCVSRGYVQKAEEVFNKMKDLGFPVSAFACNQLLLLYKRTDKKKIADVLLLMEKENLSPTLFTYKVLIDAKGQSNDITGMDQIVETMKAEGVEPDINIQANIARHYISGGVNEKALVVLKEMEGANLNENRWVTKFLLPLYASLGKADEVERLWKVCESDPRIDECMAGIEAWGKLKKVDAAEHIFNNMVKRYKTLSFRHYSGILKVYADNKMLAKGKDLVKQMADNGFRVGPLIWDALVKLYVQAGEVEKADSILQKASQQGQLKPLFNSYASIMDSYSKRGDVYNTEKMFYKMRQAGYVPRLRQYQTLVQAYIKAKTPAYGIRDRMKADNVFPNKSLGEQLVHVDAFRKTPVSDLLD